MNSPQNFGQFKINKQLQEAITDLGYEQPTPIQQRAIPLIQAGHDLLGIAQTGTGKTAAFLIPILMKLKYAQGEDPRALILTPTRELAMQIGQHAVDLSQYLDIRIAVLYGGTGKTAQRTQLEKGVDLVVATPGRFMDMYREQSLKVKLLKTMVLDEADKMMDMGFMPQIRSILEIIPIKRQNLLFSATMPDKVIDLSHEFLAFPEKVEIQPQGTTVETVNQRLYALPNFGTKINLLTYLLNQEEFSRVLIFTRTRKSADDIYKYILRKISREVRVIHANKDQNARTNAINQFSGGDLKVLVATDVVARGIDIQLVSHVINFDVPIVYEDYVHRIGRTGRASNTGEAITFVTPAEEYHIRKIEAFIRQSIPRKNIPAEVEVVDTPKEEHQLMAREIDRQKRMENPDYKGAFHQKKRKNQHSVRLRKKKR